ncbi:MAG: hypothetical protein WCG78_03835 [Candidatus Omnitrophota bacterium]
MEKRVTGIVLVVATVVAMAFFCGAIPCARAQNDPAATFDGAVKEKVTAFLAGRGHANITPLDGEIVPVQNGYFLRVNGLDEKERKYYYIELICTRAYADWALIAVTEKNAAPAKK